MIRLNPAPRLQIVQIYNQYNGLVRTTQCRRHYRLAESVSRVYSSVDIAHAQRCRTVRAKDENSDVQESVSTSFEITVFLSTKAVVI